MAFINGNEVLLSPHIHDSGGFEAGKAYAYDNPQTPTDNRKCLRYWFGYLNEELNGIWDDTFDDEGSILFPRDDESTWLEDLEYPKGTSNVTDFMNALSTHIWDEIMCSTTSIAVPTKKYTGTLDMTAAMEVNYTFGYGAKVKDAGTIILPKAATINGSKYMFAGAKRLEKINFVGEIKWTISFQSSPLDLNSAVGIINQLANYADTENEFVHSIIFSSDTISLLDNAGSVFPNDTTWKEYLITIGWNA